MEFYKWYASNLRVPRTKTALAKQLGVYVTTLNNWEREIKETEYDSKEYFLSRKKEIDEAAVEAVKNRGNAQMFRYIKQITGELVENIKIDHKGLTADDYSRLSKEAEDELGDDVQRIREVSPEPPLLSD